MPLHKLAHRRIVVHYEDQRPVRFPGNRTSGLRTRRPARFSHERLITLYHPRQADRESRAATGRALDRDVAAHHLAEAFASLVGPKTDPPGYPPRILKKFHREAMSHELGV